MNTQRITTLFLSLFLLSATGAHAQQVFPKAALDSVLESVPFTGVVLITKGTQKTYSYVNGFSDFEKTIALKETDQFVIGSISKQLTAVMVMREYDKGRIRLHVPIRTYLPELVQPWADSVTVHQLLTHTHGINEHQGDSLLFSPGTGFQYSQAGFDLLARIIERTAQLSFAEISQQLFEECGMNRTFHPDLNLHKKLVKSYAVNAEGEIVRLVTSFTAFPVAAGGFISTAGDLAKWNRLLHQGKLLSDSAYQLMFTAYDNAVRHHPVFGRTYYGYGTTVVNMDGLRQLGQTGFVPGFVSMSFYYPASGTGVVMLSNLVTGSNDIRLIFRRHTVVLDIIREYLSKKQHVKR